MEVTRGPLVECLHQGRIAVADAHGRVLHALGDPQAPVYARDVVTGEVRAVFRLG
ncbi:MAG: asparaginase [Pseudomonadota bacterium]